MGENLGLKNVKMLADGNAGFTKGIDMLAQKDFVGFGSRSWRCSMVVDNKNIVKTFEEDGKMDNCPIDPFTISYANTMLKYLKN